MNNITINKYQASLSIEELIQQAYPQQQQNWLLTYLDVFVLIIMLVVTLMALSDFESEQKIKRAQTLQQYIKETTSHRNIKSTPINPSINESPINENKNDFILPSTTITEQNNQPAASYSLSENKKELTELITEKPIEYIPQNLNKDQQKTSISKRTDIEEPQTSIKEKLLRNSLVSDIENTNDYKKHSSNQKSLPSDDTLQKQLQSTVEELGLTDSVNMKVTRGYAQLEIQDKILFKSSDSALLKAGESLLTKLTPLLTQSSGLIYIEGHTDNRPIKTKRFPSNWELGASRATSVLHFLASQKLDKSRLRAITYADTKPITDNETKEGRERNRRVSIVIKVSDKVN
jgi:chemotaxis protein MotB